MGVSFWPYCTLFDRFGECLGYCHAPRVDPSIAPKAQALRRPPFSVWEEVSTELHRLEADGIIEKIDSSPWVSNLVIAHHKNGELRLCVDLKEVNMAIIPDKYPLPTIDELSASFHGARIYTKLDMRHSNLQVPLAAESCQLTAFLTHEGVFQYRRMPYRLCSARVLFRKSYLLCYQAYQECSSSLMMWLFVAQTLRNMTTASRKSCCISRSIGSPSTRKNANLWHQRSIS